MSACDHVSILYTNNSNTCFSSSKVDKDIHTQAHMHAQTHMYMCWDIQTAWGGFLLNSNETELELKNNLYMVTAAFNIYLVIFVDQALFQTFAYFI